MKLTKSKLKQIIKEELKLAIMELEEEEEEEEEEEKEKYTKLPSVYGRKGEHGIPLTPGQVVQRLRLSIKKPT